MSLNDDTCDFCGNYCDPIGNDAAKAVLVDDGPKMWCGFCYAGADAQWGELSDELIEKFTAELRKHMEESGLGWENRGDDMQKWLFWLTCHDTDAQMRRYLEQRREKNS